uniref:Uncharacterized protein n=1 Tax=Proboscia inermis TaxID=420281 RepID=A0A7S0C7H8_9STRA|mmetsp:Transcript_32127/g.32397  ORF Transcript_32127/g.32397 Transcript_32127/m.32397 type:complete len:125 (+) Transcript_32127:102-476(+)
MAPGMEMGTGNQILGRGRGNKSPTLGMGTGTVDRIPDSVLGTGTESNDDNQLRSVARRARILCYGRGGRIPLAALEMDKRREKRILGQGRGTESPSLRWEQGRATEVTTQCWGWKRGRGTEYST